METIIITPETPIEKIRSIKPGDFVGDWRRNPDYVDTIEFVKLPAFTKVVIKCLGGQTIYATI